MKDKYYARVIILPDGKVVLSGHGMGWTKEKDGWFRTKSFTS